MLARISCAVTLAPVVARLAHAALEYVGHTEHSGDIGDHRRLPLEVKRGGPRRDSQFRDLCQQIDQFLGQAVRKVLLLFVRAQVHKRQHRDGLRRNGAGRGAAGVLGVVQPRRRPAVRSASTIGNGARQCIRRRSAAPRTSTRCGRRSPPAAARADGRAWRGGRCDCGRGDHRVGRQQSLHAIGESHAGVAVAQPRPLHLAKLVRNASAAFRGVVNRHRQQERRILGDIMGALDRQAPFTAEISLGPRVAVR